MAAAAAISLALLPISFSRNSSSSLSTSRPNKGGVKVLASIDGGEAGGVRRRRSRWREVLEEMRCNMTGSDRVLEMAKLSVLHFDWRARKDLLDILALHQKVVGVLGSLVGDFKSVGAMRQELRELQEQLEHVNRQIQISEIRLTTALDKVGHAESLANDKLLEARGELKLKAEIPISISKILANRKPRKCINVSGPPKKFHSSMKNFWYPVVFSRDLKNDSVLPIECLEDPWVVFRGADGKPGCIQDTCPHRACPLHLGTVRDGQVQCPYHGWEFSNDGKCQKMPSARMLDVRVLSIPCFEHEGMIWIWPGDAASLTPLPSLLPPHGFQIHAEIVMELPVEHGLLLDNLLDLAHAPFTHTSTFARGWSAPSLVKFLTPSSGFQGHWDPYPINMEFRPPCMVQSIIGIQKPGTLKGKYTHDCSTHLHQLHVCLPSSSKKTKLLYRMSLDFAPLTRHIPFMSAIWMHLAKQVLNEDLRLVLGQQERMISGVNVWNWPAPYDKLGVRYRLWRDALERGAKTLPFLK